MEINDYIIPSDMPIVDIMKRLDWTAKGIAYVCDSEGVLLGVITDGDIRRSIIQNGRLDISAKVAMNENPITVEESEKESAYSVMNRYLIRSVPILDRSHRIKDIKFLDEFGGLLLSANKVDAPVVIMAGGKGMRLQPYTNILPKPLIPIGERTITEHIIERFEKAGCKKFKMIVNYKKHFIKAYFRDNEEKKDIDFVDEEEFLGTAGGLRLLEGMFEDSFFVTNCDILIDGDYADIYEYHKKSGNIATVVCAVKNMKLPYGVIKTSQGGRIDEIKEKPDISSVVNTGLYVLEPEFIDRIPVGIEAQMTDVLQKCIDDGDRVGMYPVSEESWMDMGQMDELEKMRAKLYGE